MRATSLRSAGPVRSRRPPAPRGRRRGDCSDQPQSKWTRGGGSVITNKAATADAVVSSYEGHTIQPVLEPNRPLVVPIEIPDIQTWTIAPFRGGEYRPTTVTIGVRAVEPGSIYACGAMAQAVMGEKVGSITK